MTQGSLTLLLSDVDRHLPKQADWPAMPALQTLLSKGRREPLPTDLTSCLFDLFHLQAEAGRDRPVAALGALGEGLDAAGGWWLRADPVHMVADRDQLYLSACNALEVTRNEADELVAELNRLYAEDGWQFIAATPERWYLRLPRPLAMRTVPTAVAMGCRVGEALPQGDDALLFQRAMTEIQMLLHASPVNARRSEQGLLAVNSLWFWGGGELPAATAQSAWERVVANEPLVLGLARLYGIDTETPASTSLASAAVASRVLWQASVESLEQAEQALFAPLLAMLKSGELAELVILLPGLGRWQIERAALRRWWQRRKPLSSLLKVAG
jgi:hypothetical protein